MHDPRASMQDVATLPSLRVGTSPSPSPLPDIVFDLIDLTVHDDKETVLPSAACPAADNKKSDTNTASVQQQPRSQKTPPNIIQGVPLFPGLQEKTFGGTTPPPPPSAPRNTNVHVTVRQ